MAPSFAFCLLFPRSVVSCVCAAEALCAYRERKNEIAVCECSMIPGAETATNMLPATRLALSNFFRVHAWSVGVPSVSIRYLSNIGNF